MREKLPALEKEKEILYFEQKQCHNCRNLMLRYVVFCKDLPNERYQIIHEFTNFYL